ncbi:LysR substrate-binding domain-containing protein [Palleronia sp. LCG004]|uniref:LysR substrate-binding domain-containing protein n=1 Tax=Palleronia sp. LCG004 TaxID=3079304 RepID=UPI0029428044|nr:LysR substrate-binding domain-containing protein [Palleronia sp. LCG004]WOI57565.1 LysR substrate-binding domain-containing protein [Palleronia sp. LCG004]
METSDRLTEALVADDLDFYIGRIIDSADHRNLSFERIAVEPISLLVSIDHPLAGQDGLTLADCLHYDWVMQPRGNLMRATVDAYLRECNLPLPEHFVGTTLTLFSIALVHDTKAIAPVARAVAEFFVARYALMSRLTPLSIPVDIRVSDFGVVARAWEKPSPATQRVLNLIRQRAREMFGASGRQSER